MDEPVEASIAEPTPLRPPTSSVQARSLARVLLGPSRALVCAILASSFWGCLSPVELNRTVIAYDAVANDTLARQLILNIARAHNDEPLHFTGLSNIAATFNFQVGAGATPPLGGTEGGFIL